MFNRLSLSAAASPLQSLLSGVWETDVYLGDLAKVELSWGTHFTGTQLQGETLIKFTVTSVTVTASLLGAGIEHNDRKAWGG